MAMTDKQMIQTPDAWPKWPFLPLKHRNREAWQDRVGFLLEAKAPPYVVYIGSMYRAAENLEIKKLRKVKFDTLDALLKEWQID